MTLNKFPIYKMLTYKIVVTSYAFQWNRWTSKCNQGLDRTKGVSMKVLLFLMKM